ncbi:MAG: 3TM-type holin [Bacteroidota bacterium]
MPLLESIFSFLGSGVIKQVGDTIDKFVTTDAERAQAKQELTDILLQAEARAQDQLTERQRIDMNSDSWLAKNIRPLVLIFILLMYSFLSLFDTPGNVVMNGQIIATFKINPSYVELLGQWGMLIMSFYFGSRGIEKVIETMGKYNMGKKSNS